MSNRFYKTRKNRLIAGVVAGLADKFGWDLALARILAIILMVSTQFGIFLYLVLAFLLPYKEDIYPEIKLKDGRKRKNAESRNRNPAVRAGNGDAVLLKKILSNTKPDRIFSYYESMQIRFSSLRPRKEFHPLYRKPCRLPGREMHLRYLLPRRFFEAGCG